MWFPPEDKQPQMFFHPTRGSIGLFGAFRPRDDRFVFMNCKTMFNVETFSDLLYELSQHWTGDGMVLSWTTLITIMPGSWLNGNGPIRKLNLCTSRHTAQS